MLFPFALSLLTIAAPTAPLQDDPIRLRLSEENYVRGDRAKVKVRAADDGYLLVLRADGDGRVRVLFPISPDDDASIRGGKDFEIRSRGDREAFTVNEGSGVGTVLAVWTAEPLRLDDFSRNGRWDYRALAVDSGSHADESALLDLVDRMTEGKYSYDVSEYSVDEAARSRPQYRAGYYYEPWGYYGSYYRYRPYYGPRWRVGIGWGGGYHRRW